MLARYGRPCLPARFDPRPLFGNGRRARGVVRDEGDLPEPQLRDDGIQVTDLIGGGIRIAGRLIRTAPPKKIKENDSAWR